MLTHVRVPAAEAELAADALWSAGASAVEERDDGDGVVLLIVDAAPHRLGAAWEVSSVEVIDDGQDAWREHASAWRAGERLVVRPPWVEVDPEPGDVVIDIDPGNVFGSGSHATTQACLAALEGLVAPGDAVLDLGAGSGVLAVAAALLGAGRVLAVDVDAVALEITRDNATRNGVGDLVVTAGAVPEHECFDVAVANIGAGVLVGVSPLLASVVRPGGALVVSGLLVAQAAEVRHAYPAFVVEHEASAGGWVTAVLRHR